MGDEVAEMEIQDKSGSKMTADHHIWSMDLNSLSARSLHLKEGAAAAAAAGLCDDEGAPKARKPYTITKQRELWTKEEHKKFLEALQLYGRAWRRIQEHIGSKSTVQIRSHAQKFFTKVARESDGSGSDTIKSIEIPPPRPKRKPLHPYPRKLGHSSTNAISAPLQLENTHLPKSSFSEQENGSPTSVLSSFGSENTSVMLANYPNSCNSPLKSAAGSNEQESRQTQAATADKDNRSSPPCDVMTTVNQSATDLDLALFSNQSSSIGDQAPTIKLFGTTVLVSDTCSKQPSTSSAGNTVQCSDSQPSIAIQTHQRSIDVYPRLPSHLSMQNGLDADFLTGSVKGEWNSWTDGASGLLLYLPFNKENITTADAAYVPLPWLAFYGNLPFPFVAPETQVQPQARMDTCGDKKMEILEEGSWTGSGSVNGGKIGEENTGDDSENAKITMDIDSTCASRFKPCENSAFSSLKTGSSESGRGFMPYKRLDSAER